MYPCMIFWVPIQYYNDIQYGMYRNLFRGEQFDDYDEMDVGEDTSDIFYDADNEFINETIKQQY